VTERQWSAQFIGMLEALRMPAQFQQGRRYARAGHVRQLSISSSLASALILDEDGQTHRTKIAVRAFSGADWNRIERALAHQAIYAAKLLAGQLPDDIEPLLASFGLSLFPESFADLAMDCSCRGWQVPCRHLTATFYAMAESFDDDPFGILAWRGRGREDLLDRLRALRIEPVATEPHVTVAPSVSDFWTAGPRVPEPAASVPGTVRRPDALLDQLDPLLLTAGRHDVVDLLRPAYRAIAEETRTRDRRHQT
jgi:uncharacterized Zn finger protein